MEVMIPRGMMQPGVMPPETDSDSSFNKEAVNVNELRERATTIEVISQRATCVEMSKSGHKETTNRALKGQAFSTDMTSGVMPPGVMPPGAMPEEGLKQTPTYTEN